MTAIVHDIDPSRVQAAVFDLGGVFLAGGVESVRGFGARHGLSPETWDAIRLELFHEAGIWSACERGEVTLERFVARLRELVNEAGGYVSRGDAENFMGAMSDQEAGQRLRREIVDAAGRVHAVMPTALLTNNILEWRQGWRGLLDLATLFDVVIDSSEVGIRKPEPAIYELTRTKLDLPHEAIFFLDDLGVNLKPARALGWQTLRYDDTERVLAVLEALVASRPPRP
ncbi:MAG TPA: HAD-IA family hydrolase [Candidatus Binatia bacterium]